ncbi:helix-turn-helix domain-containing protein [Rhizorhabdus dicambivorans]|uniref:AraC family transcriptional regulator n=1 Tax=Rhizorhabdus dicambivorans TaxID=1850238 RepID=A0A2A4FV84_9SPHN|nr:helix-turn-helix domain-containing protein [Rhizorhabdus dicambivorans]ATE64536.1 AraC family transcriptional regulator [Rhizorhabdus dicambivorans]PCE41630.1 AraC family transcriptional regulator [Rhizorhabdus dicambivorans]
MKAGEREWIQVSHEMGALLGGGTVPQKAWPADPVALGFRYGGVGAPATVHWHAAPRPSDFEGEPLVLIVAADAVRRLFGTLPAGISSGFHITRELREIALAIRDCALPEAAREPYRLAKSIELLCDTLRLIGADALVPVLGDGLLSQEDSRRILAARAMIDERWAEKLTLDKLSRACGLNRAKLTRGFREMFDCSIADALAEKRLEGARSLLLSTDLPIASIGYRCGYLNNASFTRAFTRRFGTAPTQYRAGRLAA